MSTMTGQLMLKAQGATKYGYFQPDGTHVYAPCPTCRESIYAAHLAWATVPQRLRALHEQIYSHLMYDHAEATR